MSKKTLNQANLETLGAPQLAALLMEVSTGSADIKRRLRLELAHNLGASELARDVRKRLVSLRKSKSYVGWRRRKSMIKDLSTQTAMITEKIAPDEPAIAFDLLWEFIGIAPSIYERVDDSRGDVGDVFRDALLHFEEIAPRAMLNPEAVAERVWEVIKDNGYGEWDGIVSLMAPTMGVSGLAHLKQLVEAYAAAPPQEDDEDHEAIQFIRQLRGGSNYAADRKARLIKSCLQEIAIAAGDTGAYIAQYSASDLKRKDIAAEVAVLWLEAGKAREALALLTQAEQDGRDFGREAWDTAYIACLIALGQQDAAQAHRWACFEASLDDQHLRAFLKEMPDFEDIEAEEQARGFALEYPQFGSALAFFLRWPDLRAAEQLILVRPNEIDGDHYTLMTAAAEALRARHPLAAVLVWRKMIDFSLSKGRSSRYGHAAEHLADCATMDGEIEDYGGFPDHAGYLHTLQSRHERKTSFWAKVR